MNGRNVKKPNRKTAASFARTATKDAHDILMSEANPLVVATLDILNETLRGRVTGADYQSLVLANTLLPLKNRPDLIEAGDYGDAVRILKSFALLQKSEGTEAHLEKACAFPGPAKSLFVARAAATVESIAETVGAALPDEFLKEYGYSLCDLLNSGGLDDTLRDRMALAFRRLAAATESRMEIRQNGENGEFYASPRKPLDVTQSWSAVPQVATRPAPQ